MCVFDHPPTPCNDVCGHIKFKKNLDDMLFVMENMPPLPCNDPQDLSVEELAVINEHLTKKVSQQNKVIEETLKKIQDAIRIQK